MNSSIKEMIHRKYQHCRLSMPEIQFQVLECLYLAWNNKKTPINQRDLITQLFIDGYHTAHDFIVNGGLETNKRNLRRIIHVIRTEHGVPIISNNQGYLFPTTQEQLNEYIQTFEIDTKKKIASLYDTIKSMKQCAKEFNNTQI